MTSTITPVRFSLVLALALAACGGTSASPAAPTGAAPSVQARCEAFFARARTCSEPYIAGLVDVRVELDNPPGVAARADAEGKDAIVTQAMAEWATDSQPENVTRMCTETVAQVPPEQVSAMMAGAERCLAEAECDAFATCAKDLHRMMLAPR